MPTGTQGTTATWTHHPVVHRVWKQVTFADNGVAKVLGYRPANSIVIRGGAVVTQAFNAGTTNTLNIGTAGDDDGFATLIALGTVGVISADEMATTNDAYSASDEAITATVVLTGTAATTGAAYVWVEYVILN